MHVEPFSGMPETLRIAPASTPAQRSALEIWLTDAIRCQRSIRPAVVYVPSRQWLAIAATYETDEFRDRIREGAEPVIKGEQLLQEALKASGIAEKIRADGNLRLYMQADYDSLKDKPALNELFLPALAAMAHGYSSPQIDKCGQEYGCLVTVRFITGTLEPESIEVEPAPALPPGAGYFLAPKPESQQVIKNGEGKQ